MKASSQYSMFRSARKEACQQECSMIYIIQSNDLHQTKQWFIAHKRMVYKAETYGLASPQEDVPIFDTHLFPLITKK